MTLTTPASGTAAPAVSLDGFDVLDACHRQTLVALDKLAALVESVEKGDPDAQARATALELIEFFSTTAREHHLDEERHVFPALLAGGDPEVVQAVLRLQQDHRWMDVDWRELSPLVAAVGGGQSGYDVGALREGVEIFIALSHDHIVLEESSIYPQARRQLARGALKEMGREMAARRRARRLAGSARP